ncbi:MAG: AAA family ATPase [Minisyncoccia bacterium]
MNTYFKEPRLTISSFQDLLIRILIQIFYLVFIALTFILVTSNLNHLKFLGYLFGLFLIERIIHFRNADWALWEPSRFKVKRINLNWFLTPASREAILESYRKSLIFNKNFYLVLLQKLFYLKDIKIILQRLEINHQDFLTKIENELQVEVQNNPQDLVQKIEELVKIAFDLGLEYNEKFIEPRVLFVSLAFINDSYVQKVFDLFNINRDGIEALMILSRYSKSAISMRNLPLGVGGFAHKPLKIRHRVMNRVWTARPTKILDDYSNDLTDLARAQKVGLLIGHSNEYNQLINILSRSEGNNVVLVGERSSGKSTIVSHLAFEIIQDNVPPVLFDKRLISLSPTKLLSDAPSDILAKRVQEIINEILIAGNIILHLEDFELFFKSGANEINLADLFMPLFRANAIPIIAETYPLAFQNIIELHGEINDLFEKINVESISKNEAIIFLSYSSLLLEKSFKISITFSAIKKAVDIADRYLKPKLLPSSAEDLLKTACMEAKKQGLKTLDANFVVEVAEVQIKIPLAQATKIEAEKLLNLETLIHQKFIDQEIAVKAVSNALRTYRAGLARKGGPIASFLFVGPTGVGKTELSKILTEIQFGSEKFMIRFDMSEYQDKQSINRFIGTTQSGAYNSLTEAVLAQPYSLILLDEFEKAHPDILNLFLQVLDEGRLTDVSGRTVNFENTIIIATSNALSDFIKESLAQGLTMEQITDDLKKKLTSYFKPELLNRFSDVIVFKDLSKEDLQGIVKIQLNNLNKTLKTVHGIDLFYNDDVVNKLVEIGYSPIFGARPLRQAITENIQNPLANKILNKEIGRGNVLQLVLKNNAIEIQIVS